MTYTNALKDVLHNLSLSENGNNNLTEVKKQYYRGLVMGIVSYARYKGWDWDSAIRDIILNLPIDCIAFDYFLPKHWLEDFRRMNIILQNTE